MKIRWPVCLLTILALSLGTTQAQQSSQASPAVQLANLRQDVQLLQREFAKAKLSMEGLQRENAALRKNLETMVEAQNKLTTSFNNHLQANEQRLNQLAATLQAADEKQKEVLIAEFSRQVENLARQTQAALDKLAAAIEQQPASMQPAVAFDDDFPRNGIRYTVQRGDTLSGIARKFNSQVSWIQGANKIAKPESLQVGDTIFVPQPE